VAHKLDVLARDCEAEGRDYGAIEKTTIIGGDVLADAGGFVASMERMAKLGIELVWLCPPGPDPVGWVRRAGEEIVPRLTQLA
jgi:hypothetical protein